MAVWRVALALALLVAIVWWMFNENRDATNFPPVVEDASIAHHHVWKSEGVSLSYSADLSNLQPDRCSSIAAKKQLIPNRIHFVFGMNEDFGGRPFGFIQYAAVMSAKVNGKPDGIYFHYVYEPSGPWWDLTKPHVTLVRARNFTTMFGHYFERHAHRADVLRIEILYKFGGIYVDSDTWVVQPFKPLLHNECVMGYEGGEKYALGNAAILAAPGSGFIDKWIATYAAFNGKNWNFNGLVVPTRLAIEYTDEICAAPPHSFLSPLWDDKGIDYMHRERTPEDCEKHLHKVVTAEGDTRVTLWGPGHYGSHLWLSAIRKKNIPERLANITYIRTANTLMTHLMRPVFAELGIRDEGDWPTVTGYEDAYWHPDNKEKKGN